MSYYTENWNNSLVFLSHEKDEEGDNKILVMLSNEKTNGGRKLSLTIVNNYQIDDAIKNHIMSNLEAFLNGKN